MARLERIISGKGEIKIPVADFEDSLAIILYTQVIRDPQNQYINDFWEPRRSEYAKVTFGIGSYVSRELTVRYEQQAFPIWYAQGAQNLKSMICMYNGILDSFLELAACISECIPIGKANLIELHPYNTYQETDIRFKCYTSTALRLVLVSQSLVSCPGNAGQPTPPPPPPLPLPKLRPDENLSDSTYPASPPYPDSPENTVPFPGDSMEGEITYPVGGECDSVEVEFLWVTPIDPPGNTVTRLLWGEVTDVRFELNAQGAQVVADCRGKQFGAGSQDCEPQPLSIQLISFGGAVEGDVEYNLIRVEVV